jgi:hypothetical protein
MVIISIDSKPSTTRLKYDTLAIVKEIEKVMLNKLEKKSFDIQNGYQAEIAVRFEVRITISRDSRFASTNFPCAILDHFINSFGIM